MRASPSSRATKIKRLAFAFLPAIVLFGSAEVLIRATGAAETCPGRTASPGLVCDPLLYFKNRPDLILYGRPLNAAGFRGREFTPKRPGVFRILALGDSCTFGVAPPSLGHYVRAPYPRLLEKMIDLKNGPDRVEVLNAGTPGYNSYQGLLLLRTKLRGLDPDLITVRFGWNDHLMSATSSRSSPFRDSSNPILRGLKGILRRTAIYPFAVRVALEIDARTRPEPSRRLPTEWVPTLSLEDYEAALRSIVELGRARGARVWLLTAPQAFSSEAALKRYEALQPDAIARVLLRFSGISTFARMREIHDRYNDATREVAAELDAPLVDMDGIYRQAEEDDLFSIEDGLHPTPRGHLLEARTLYRELLRSGILESPPGETRQVPAVTSSSTP
jgi:lysophospholipase L1-like esterase